MTANPHTNAPARLPDPTWRVGVEIELMAPRGRTRADLADAIAADEGATVRRFFHAQSEPSKVPGMALFHNITLGFEVETGDGWLARCVDDITLQADCDRTAAPKPGWYRVVSDDLRLLRLVGLHGRADGTLADAVTPVADLYGTTPQAGASGLVRVADDGGASVCLAAPLPGERERPCELITAPLDGHLTATITPWLTRATELGFFVPAEAAVHVHYDATSLRSARVLRDLVRLWRRHGRAIRNAVGVNARCQRLGTWPEALSTTVEAPDFPDLTWAEAMARLRKLKLSKYCDLNLRNLVNDSQEKPTVELRVLPGAITPGPIVAGALLGEALLTAAVDGRTAKVPLREALPLPDAVWRALAGAS